MLLRLAYSLLLYLCLPLAYGYFLIRGVREPGYLGGWLQRLGFGAVPHSGGICLHAASVGEVQAAAPLARALAARHPELPLVVTVFTPTGHERARKALGDVAHIRYLPLDLPGAMRRFMLRASPSLLLVMETEIWPNLLRACRRREVPVMVVNGRLSDQSVQRYARWPLRPLMTDAVSGLARVAAASAADAERFAALGVPKDAITDTGNLKFDLTLPDTASEEGKALRRVWQAEERPVWVAASTHAGEEEAVLDAFARLRVRYPDLLLILVPRHPQRFNTVADNLHKRELSFARRSRNEAADSLTQVVLGDTLGELLQFYAAADLAFVGGSLVPGIGGHNLLEPAALRLPVVVGPHLGGWGQVADWLQAAGALCRVVDAAAMDEAVAECLGDDRGRMMAGLAAARVVDDHGGALERTLRLIPPLLTPAGNA